MATTRELKPFQREKEKRYEEETYVGNLDPFP